MAQAITPWLSWPACGGKTANCCTEHCYFLNYGSQCQTLKVKVFGIQFSGELSVSVCQLKWFRAEVWCGRDLARCFPCCLNEFGWDVTAYFPPCLCTEDGRLFVCCGVSSVLVLLMAGNHWTGTSPSTVFLIALSSHSHCQNEMLTVCSALSSLSRSLRASELLIACDCWHCWAYPLYSTGNKI